MVDLIMSIDTSTPMLKLEHFLEQASVVLSCWSKWLYGFK